MAKMPKVLLLIDSGRSSGREMIRGITKYVQLYGPWVFFQELSYYRMIHSWSGDSIYNSKGRKILSDLLGKHEVDGFLADMPSTKVAEELIPKVRDI